MGTTDFLDMRTVFLRVALTYPNGRLDLHGLQTCWRPPGPRGRPWTDARLFAAIDALVDAGFVERRDVPTGYDLVATAAGYDRFDVAARPGVDRALYP